MLRFKNFLLERAMAGYGRLSPGELAKTNAQTGKLRLDILRQVMQDGQEIPTITGEIIEE